jgi:hypothetical protein
MTKENKMKDDRIRSYIMMVEKYKQVPDFNMGYYSEFICAEALSEDGTIIPLNTKKQYFEIYGSLNVLNSKQFTTGSIIVTDADVRTDYVEMFNSKRGRGKTYFSIMHEIAKDIEKH